MTKLHFRFFFTALFAIAALISGSWKKAELFSTEPKTSTGERSTFWTVSKAGGVEEWRFTSDTTVKKVRVVFEHTDDGRFDCCGLAWCSAFGEKSSLCLLERDSKRRRGFFQPIPLSAGKRAEFSDGEQVVNIGGYGSKVYAQDYVTYGSKRNAVLFWDEGKMERIYQLPELSSFGIADIAVDSSGNAWMIVHEYSEEKDDSGFLLRGFNSSGVMIASVPVKDYSEEHAYGFMLIEGQFYVAFGSSSERYPSQIVAFNYKNYEMQPGKRIPFYIDAHDLASKNPGMPKIPILNNVDCNNQLRKAQ